jgi:hypothetical protein
VGVGSLTLRGCNPYTDVQFDLQFIKPFKSEANDEWTFEDNGNNTCTVTWINSGLLPAGMARLMGPMIKSQLNKQFVEGLNNLEKLCVA